MEKRSPITGPQCIDLLTLATRLTSDEFQKRHRWFALLTDPEFDVTQLPPIHWEDEATEEPKLPTYPADGEVFELTSESLGGLEMVEQDESTGTWRFTGQKLEGPQTRKFKLVSIGWQPTFEAVKTELARHGKIPEGQWRKAFKGAYLKRDRTSSIGVADASWVDPKNRVVFPYVDAHGVGTFHWTGYSFGDYWRWLVEVE